MMILFDLRIFFSNGLVELNHQPGRTVSGDASPKHGQESNSLGDAKHERIAGASGESVGRRRSEVSELRGVYVFDIMYVHVAFFGVKTPTKKRRFRTFVQCFGGSYNILCQ